MDSETTADNVETKSTEKGNKMKEIRWFKTIKEKYKMTQAI